MSQPREMDRDAVGRGAFWLAAGSFALVFAYWLQHDRGMAPCALCLWERVPYRVLIGAGLAWMALGLAGRSGGPMRLLVLAILLVAFGLGVLHLGVEQHWWPSPLPECAAPRFTGGSFAERLAAMPARPAKPCDAANDLIGAVPVSVVDLTLAYATVLLVVALRLGRGRRAGTFAPARDR